MLWFKRKPRNRRLGREFVLDVKLRSSQVRAARARMAAVALAVVFTTVLGVFLLWHAGNWALARLVYENPAFSIDNVEVQTDGVIPVEQLRRWTGVRPGDNLLELDLAGVARNLQLVSLVQSASVERILPHTLRVRVIEREGVAQVNIPRPRPNGGLELATLQLDEDGYIILPLEAQLRGMVNCPQSEPLPQLVGIPSGDLQPGRRLEAPQVQAALQFLTAFYGSPMAGLVDIKRVDVSSPGVLIVNTSQGAEVTFGLNDPERQLRRWQQIVDAGQQQRIPLALATLDLAVSNNVPVTWLEASVVPPVSPKAPKHLKKKHV